MDADPPRLCEGTTRRLLGHVLLAGPETPGVGGARIDGARRPPFYGVTIQGFFMRHSFRFGLGLAGALVLSATAMGAAKAAVTRHTPQGVATMWELGE